MTCTRNSGTFACGSATLYIVLDDGGFPTLYSGRVYSLRVLARDDAAALANTDWRTLLAGPNPPQPPPELRTYRGVSDPAVLRVAQ
jgi:hypothetical protein